MEDPPTVLSSVPTEVVLKLELRKSVAAHEGWGGFKDSVEWRGDDGKKEERGGKLGVSSDSGSSPVTDSTGIITHFEAAQSTQSKAALNSDSLYQQDISCRTSLNLHLSSDTDVKLRLLAGAFNWWVERSTGLKSSRERRPRSNVGVDIKFTEWSAGTFGLQSRPIGLSTWSEPPGDNGICVLPVGKMTKALPSPGTPWKLACKLSQSRSPSSPRSLEGGHRNIEKDKEKSPKIRVLLATVMVTISAVASPPSVALCHGTYSSRTTVLETVLVLGFVTSQIGLKSQLKPRIKTKTDVKSPPEPVLQGGPARFRFSNY
ncbi:hypothetical protein B0H17DRAFT_1139649 [Mycena rosella]|uniref:Uncharacterized protein n=1 Tax=Mycena rosella TaxID=1033263 RepID=A0AAD7D580_MYCRO|nr:hypothetical protein B0H17DRAFT_1139649 [Mycena rosella]